MKPRRRAAQSDRIGKKRPNKPRRKPHQPLLPGVHAGRHADHILLQSAMGIDRDLDVLSATGPLRT